MRVAAVQLNSTEDKDRNIATADRLTRAAAADGATLVLLPEKFDVLGTHGDYLRGAETLDRPGGRTGRARPRASWASTSWPARSSSAARAASKLGNTSIHFGPDGEIKAVYRKIHMFDVVVGGQGVPRVGVRGAGRRDRDHGDARRAAARA